MKYTHIIVLASICMFVKAAKTERKSFNEEHDRGLRSRHLRESHPQEDSRNLYYGGGGITKITTDITECVNDCLCEVIDESVSILWLAARL